MINSINFNSYTIKLKAPDDHKGHKRHNNPCFSKKKSSSARLCSGWSKYS